MAKIIKFPLDNSERRVLRKARRKKKNPEDFGQLNLFSSATKKGVVIELPEGGSYFENGLLLLDSEANRAEELLLKSIDTEDHKSDAFCNLGIISYQKKDTVTAIDYFTKALELVPRHFESHYNLANIYFEVGNYKLAAVHYKFASEIEPKDANVRYNLGLVLANLEDYEGAVSQLEVYLNLGDSQDEEVLNLITKIRGTSKLKH